MRTAVWGVVCLVLFLSSAGCVNMDTWNKESQGALNTNLNACAAQGMTKSELIMQVGPPTAKEVVEDGGEIWVYDVVDRGNTTTTGQMGAFGTFSATTATNEEKSRVTVRFNKKGAMVSTATSGPARGQFRFLRPAPR